MFFAFACKKNADSIIPASDPTTMALAFAPHSNVSTSYDDTYFYVESDGLAQHQMMVGIYTWIDQFPIPQAFKNGESKWSIPLQPAYADDPIGIEGHFQKGAIAIAVNGIPIFNPINASGLISKQIGELDAFGGHAGRADDYHYHAAPLHLQTSDNLPIRFRWICYLWIFRT
ncbi:MAG: YHYH protein [Aureispira sp.]|nr:YHYH protein [Aureispira sp.]